MLYDTVCVHIYIYIYIGTSVCDICVCVCVYIYKYIYKYIYIHMTSQNASVDVYGSAICHTQSCSITILADSTLSKFTFDR